MVAKIKKPLIFNVLFFISAIQEPILKKNIVEDYIIQI